MRVSDLIEVLGKCDQEAEVIISTVDSRAGHNSSRINIAYQILQSDYELKLNETTGKVDKIPYTKLLVVLEE